MRFFNQIIAKKCNGNKCQKSVSPRPRLHRSPRYLSLYRQVLILVKRLHYAMMGSGLELTPEMQMVIS